MTKKFKVVVLDLDGTLTNSKKELSDRNRSLLIELQEKGIKVVLASGRPPQGIKPVADALELKKYGGYILSFNGGIITDAATERVIFSNELPVELIEPLYRNVKSMGLEIVSYKDNCVVTEGPTNKYVEFEARLNGIDIIATNNFITEFTAPVPKCLAVGDSDKIEILERRMKELFSDKIGIYRSEPFFLELVPLNIDKAYSLSKLLSHIGQQRENMIAFGDGFNDLSMIEYAGCGVAMANAQDVVKSCADEVTSSNDEDGVAHFIESNIDKF